MASIQTLTLNKKKFALLPFSSYEKIVAQLEELKDLKGIKKQYNKELAAAMKEIENGNFYTHEQVKRKLNGK